MLNKKSTNKPIIGISTNFQDITDMPFADHQRIYVNKGYIDSILQAGGAPLLLPMTTDLETTDNLLNLVDGVMLSGGQDVHPSLYKEDPHPLLGSTCKERDLFEMHLIKRMFEKKKPLLGICRGHQLINVFFGGTLYQDLSLHSSSQTINHRQTEKWDKASHKIDLIPGGKLHNTFGKNSLSTNSFHHQAVKDLAPGFSIAAKSHDGIIEGMVYNDSSSWIVSVQWHPELMIYNNGEMKPLFEAFVNEAEMRRNLK